MMWFLILIIDIASVLSMTRPPKDMFSRLVEGYRRACLPLQNTKTSCCGHCSHDDTCYDKDNCCFDKFEDFGKALKSRRHDILSKICLQPKLAYQVSADHRTVDTTTAVWMSDHCYEESDLISIELCKNPGMNNHFSSIVPVSADEDEAPYFKEEGYKHYIPFRNKFCSKCFSVKNEAGHIYWDISIKCMHKISFNHENFLHVIKENNCDVYFKRSVFDFAPQQCHYPVYPTISSCNVTGLWPEYDKGIEAACHAFVDIFNQTYRNYFCYVCNADNPEPPELWSCERQTKIDAVPYSMDLSIDLISQIEDGVVLGCDPETQFVDLKQMVCRSFHCDGFTFDENTCKPRRIRYNSYCFVMSVKLTFGTQNPFREEELDIIQIYDTVKQEVTTYIQRTELKVVKVYVRTMNQSGVNVVDYLIVQLFIDLIDKFGRLKRLAEHLNARPCYTGTSNVFPWCELVLYDKESETDQELIIPVITTPKPDIKRSLDSGQSNYCSDKKLQVINKLYFCLHVELTTKELQMKIDDNILIITINSTEVFRFSPWEYEFADKVVKLCMEDYLKIYKIMPTNMDENSSMIHEVANEMYFATFLIIPFVHNI